MDFPIEIYLADSDSRIWLKSNSEFGQFDEPVDPQFTPDDLFIFTRALELNRGTVIKRTFKGGELERLKDLGLLVRRPERYGDMTITGAELHLGDLQELLRRRLYAVLIKPLEVPLNRASTAARERGQQILHIRLELRFDQVQSFQYPWELLHGDRSLDCEIRSSR